MADNASPVTSPPLFLEVFCEVSCKEYRFTTGTKAEFAVSVINRKLGSLKSRVVYIEAAKEGEEPISFGDNAYLVNYGHGWKLKTVTDADLPGPEKMDVLQRHLPHQFPSLSSMGSEQSKSKTDSKPEIGDKNLRYMGRILVAFVLMFVLGGLFTMALENLPSYQEMTDIITKSLQRQLLCYTKTRVILTPTSNLRETIKAMTSTITTSSINTTSGQGCMRIVEGASKVLGKDNV